jgi:two-component system alkaline phosphatase synthesis response regulator PhoP
MPELLLAEDKEALVLMLQDRLTFAGYRVTVARDGATALELATRTDFDCIVLDVALPVKNGFDVCRELRQRNVTSPILMLTARAQISDRVHGLRLGADDYVTKPFDMRELLARIEALLRRRLPSRLPATPDVYRLGALELDFRSGEVRRNGEPVELSALELKVLRYLVEHRGSVVTRQELLSNVWQHDEPPLTRTVDVRVGALRQKLEDDPTRPTLITTVHGVGYKLIG